MARNRRRDAAPQARVTPGLQQAYMAHHFPGFVYRREGGTMVWRGRLQPRPVSPEYQVEITYRLRRVPRVWVRSPAIVPGAPHLYPDGNLCLYWPKEWMWRADCFISQTIVPWAAAWLLYYELWLDTGEWLGPSSHQVPKSEVV